MEQIKEFEDAAAATHSYTDAQIERMFYSLHVGSEADIGRIVKILRTHRPSLEREIVRKHLQEDKTG